MNPIPPYLQDIARHFATLYPLVEIQQVSASEGTLVGRYLNNPVGYAKEILGVDLIPIQKTIAQTLTTFPYKVLVRAGHSVGKSFLQAVLVSWWFDTHNPGICLTTAPTARQVQDILWKEVRRLRANALHPLAKGGFVGPKIPRLETLQDHFAHGFTARDGSRFQGHHGPAVLILFDEATGISPIFWDALEPMLGGNHYGFLAIYNPTDQSSPPYIEERQPGYHPVITMSCMDHPNIALELNGQPPLIPSAVRLGRLREMLEKWATTIPANEATAYDVKLGDVWYRPGPVAEARLLGRWPRQAVNAVWGEFIFDYMLTKELPDTGPLQIGADLARYGDDFSVFHVRKGGVSLHHEAHNGWDGPRVMARLQALAVQWAKPYKLDPKKVTIAIDSTGMGGSIVTDFARKDGWRFVDVNSSMRIPENEDYPNLRSALWFGVAEEAIKGNVSLKRLVKNCPNVIEDLRRELHAPKYRLDARGRREVESKDETKQRLGGASPDNADGFNLAYCNVTPVEERIAGRVRVPQ